MDFPPNLCRSAPGFPSLRKAEIFIPAITSLPYASSLHRQHKSGHRVVYENAYQTWKAYTFRFS